MYETTTLMINRNPVTVAKGSTVAAAIAIFHGSTAIFTRRSVGGSWRGPLCGMGICQECRVIIDGTPHRLACQTICAENMQVETGEKS